MSGNPKSKIQTALFGAATNRTKTKPIQNPNGIWGGRAGAGGEGHATVPAKSFGLVRPQTSQRKGTMLDSPMGGPKWAPISRGGFCWKPSPDVQPRVMEIGAQFLETRWTRCCGKTPALFKESNKLHAGHSRRKQSGTIDVCRS